jgi:hypothetical protein
MQLARCIMSVAEQSWHNIEHVIVSDGPGDFADLELYTRQVSRHYGHRIGFDALSEHDPAISWGTRARRRGLELASGPLVAWLDDDDAFRPDHVETLAHALLTENVDFVFSRMWIGPAWPQPFQRAENAIHGGPPYPDRASIHGLQMVLHRRELLDVATVPDSDSPEWDMISAWIDAGAKWAFVNRVTVDAYCHD